MLSLKSTTRLLTLSLFALAASGCATTGKTFQVYPPAADLQVEAKPKPGPEIVTSAQAAAAHNIAIEEWGERGWRAVARVCRWAEANGGKFNCPKSPDT